MDNSKKSLTFAVVKVTIMNINIINLKKGVLIEVSHITKDFNRIFTDRYAIFVRDRWNFEDNEFKEIFKQRGLRGCYIGERKNKHPHDTSVYDIWDLTKVFPEVEFEDNSIELEKFREF